MGMKISISSLYDVTKVLGTKAGSELQDFIVFSQQAFGEIVRAVKGNLTLRENIKGLILELSATNGKPIVVNVGVNIIGCIPLRCKHNSDSITGLNWGYTQDNSIMLTIYFREATVSARQVTVYFFQE